MSTLILCSASGAPGVTVTGLGLTLTWPRDVLLVDADRTPSQSILAGYLRGRPAHDLGLPALLQAHREHRSLADALVPCSMPLPQPPPHRRDPVGTADRRFVPGFAHLGSVDVFGGAWRELGVAFAEARFDVIVDAGRVGTRGLPGDLVDAATRVALVCRTSLVSLAAVRLYLAPLLEQAPAGRVGLVLVGPGRPYRAAEVAQQFGVEVIANIAWDPAGAADLHEGQALSARWRGQALARSYVAASGTVSAALEAERLEIGAP